MTSNGIGWEGVMADFKTVERQARQLYVIGGVSLIFIMLLTASDVMLRLVAQPIVGTYELVTFGGALVVGFSLPYVSLRRGHFFVDFLINQFPRRVKIGFQVITRIMAVAFFMLLSWNLIKYALDLRRVGEVSPTLNIPYYPFVFVIGICCIFECLTLSADIPKIWGGKYE
jgi:TRAP-type C4-dicarboxylate transport system permease small subunit